MVWLRLYTQILNDPKVQRLPPELFKAWINLLCVAKDHDGILPDIETIAFALRATVAEAQSVIHSLTTQGLIDSEEGKFFPHNWKSWQYASDISTERVQRFRKRERNVSVTPPDREIDTDTDTDREKDARTRAPYAFVGRIISLTQIDYDQWVASFPNVTLRPYLEARDIFLWELPEDDNRRRRWMTSTASDLRNKNSGNGITKPAHRKPAEGSFRKVFEPELPKPPMTEEEAAARAKQVAKYLKPRPMPKARETH